jgi:hypothetical protein
MVESYTEIEQHLPNSPDVLLAMVPLLVSGKTDGLKTYWQTLFHGWPHSQSQA